MKRNNLRLFRMKQGLMSKEMAEKLDVDKTYYSNVETGKIDPSYSFCERFYETFKGLYDDFWFLFKKTE